MIDKKIQKLESQISELKERKSRIDHAKSVIRIGTRIVDKETNNEAVVDGLKKGCIDFSAKYTDGSYSRGYHFEVDNWEVIG